MIPTINRLLVIGDSISFHAPAHNLGWEGSWGMAASSNAHDYVHLIAKKIAAFQDGSAPEVKVLAEGGGTLIGRIPWMKTIEGFRPDVAIIQMGENEKSTTPDQFQHPYEAILQAILRENPSARLFCTGVWSPPNGSSTKDRIIRAICSQYGATFIDLTEINADPLHLAKSENRFDHIGVNWHPGDRGMQAYADALWSGLTSSRPENEAAPDRPPQPTGRRYQAVEDWSGDSGLNWEPQPVTAGANGRRMAIFEKNAARTCRFMLAAEKIKGQTLKIVSRVNSTNAGCPPDKAAIIFALSLTDAEGHKSTCGVSISEASSGWRKIGVREEIPDNTVIIELVIGAQNPPDSILFDPITIESFPTR